MLIPQISWIKVLVLCLYIHKSMRFIYTSPKPGFIPLEAIVPCWECKRCTLPEVKAKSTHSFPPSTAIWTHLHCFMERRNLPHIFIPRWFVIHIYSSASIPGFHVDVHHFCLKKSSYFMHKSLSNAAGVLLPVYGSLHGLSNNQQIRSYSCYQDPGCSRKHRLLLG